MINRLRVLEIAGSVAGGYAAKLLGNSGALVTKLTIGTDEVRPDAAAVALYLDQGKELRVLQSVTELDPFVSSADIVIQSASLDPLVSAIDGLTGYPRCVNVRISPFGETGPYSGYRSNDLTDQAVSGHLFLNGDPGREPLQGPEHQVAYAAGTHAAIGALAAVRARTFTGRGQRVEVTHHEVMSALHQFTLLRYTHNGNILSRMGNRYAGPGRPAGLYRCGDGLISLIAPRGDQLETLVSIAGLDHLLDRPEINGIYDLMHHPTLLEEHLAKWLAEQNLEETIELLQAVRVPAASVSTMSDLLADEHLNARDYWRPAEVQDQEELRTPRSPFLVTVADDYPADHSSANRREDDISDGPMSGIRVLDLTRVWAGPCATRILADLGADVIMIEAPWARGGASIDETSVMATHYYPDDEPGDVHWNRIGFSNKFNLNKRNVALDLSKPGAIAVLERLVKEADVLIENYSPRVMPQFGLDQDRLHKLNPSLIYVTMPGFGRSGPLRDRVAYGPVVDSQAGLSVLMGYEGESARKAGVAWPDPVAGIHAAYATIAAIVDRADDGRGRTVELAQLEATIAMAGHAVVEYQLTGEEPKPIGNGHRKFSPHGVYRCSGDDRWFAIAVVDERSWLGLCKAAGFDQRWVRWSEADRRAKQDMIGEAISSWACDLAVEEIVERLQKAGVPAAPVSDASQVMGDLHHRARSFFVDLEHPDAGTHAWPTVPIRLSETPATYRRPGAKLNQHGREILREIAGYDNAAIESMYEAGIITDRPPG